MTGGFAFEPAGEASWRRLEAAYRLERRLGRHVVVSPSAAVRTEVRRRLETLCPALTQVSPAVDTVAAIEAAARAHTTDARLPVVWIEAPNEASQDAAWSTALAQLNQAREHLGQTRPVFVVLAGPPGLDTRVAQRAPDLWSVIRTPFVFGDTMHPVGDAPRPFQWLHVSDVHLREEGDWRADAVLDALVRDLPDLLRRAEVAPDAVFLTGDVAWSGQPKQYAVAQGFLGALFDVLKLDPHRQLHLVPGNHDVDRRAVSRLVRNDQERLLKLEGEAFRGEVGEIVGKPEELAPYGARLAAWAQFVSHVCGPARGVSTALPWRVDEVDLGAYTVGVAALCSAWACGPDEDKSGRIVLGERQVRAALSELKHCPVRVALLHHPVDWLHEAERDTVSELLRAEFHLVLHGHLHQSRSVAVTSGSGTALVSGAGAAYAGTGWKHGVQAGCFDPTTGAVSLRSWTYSARDGGYWHVDPDLGRDVKDGVLRYTLRPVVVAAAQRQASESLLTRLCRGLARLYDTTRFMGMAEHSQKPTASFSDLFVPLDFSRGMREEEATLPLSVLAPRLVSAQGEPAARVVVLGDPGSGKSTLCRHLAVQAASAEVPRLPLLVALRDMVRQGMREGLLAFAAAEMTARLSMQVDPAALEALCREGQAVLLVDGLDEVVEPAQLERVREMLLGFAQSWPKVPLLATSRVVGYDRAALPQHGFEHLRLAPFNDVQLETFIERWMSLVEPHDPVARSEGRASLLAALAAEPRAKELARTPLFATLIALVHRSEAQLPGERARLYEMVVRTLLETWPAQRGQRFDAIDEGRQREVLERLALRLQEQRDVRDREGITITRRELVKQLTELLSERDWADRSTTEVAVLVERWVQHLEAGTGLLVEAQPGVFAPLHLSLFEFLAGRALLRRESARGDAAVAAFVKGHLGQDHWEETLLLMMGSEATRTSLIDAVCSVLCEVGSWRAWSMGVGLLRDEVDLSPLWRTRMLDGVTFAALTERPDDWDLVAQKLADVRLFSQRHREAVEAWGNVALRTLPVENLAGVVGLYNPEPPGVIAERSDGEAVVVAMLDFHPIHRWGLWARAVATGREWVRWHARGSVALAFWRGLEALSGTAQAPAAAALLGLARRGGWLGWSSLRAVGALCNAPQTGGRIGFPATLAVGLRDLHMLLDGKVNDLVHPSTSLESTREFARVFSLMSAREFTRTLIAHDGPSITGRSAESLKSSLRFDFARYFARDPTLDFATAFSSAHPGRFEQSIQFLLAKHFTQYLTRGNMWAFVRKFTAKIFQFNPKIKLDHDHSPRALFNFIDPWSALERSSTNVEVHTAASILLTSLVTDAYFGIMQGAQGALPLEEVAHLATARVHNRWLYLFFEHLAQQAPKTPEHHALLIALGLAQYQTTGRWPWGSWWQQTFANEAPTHWMPAAMWHMCFAVGEPDNPAHEVAVDAAFARGADPAEPDAWPELAEALREHRLHATPPEVLALYDHGDDPQPGAGDAGDA